MVNQKMSSVISLISNPDHKDFFGDKIVFLMDFFRLGLQKTLDEPRWVSEIGFFFKNMNNSASWKWI